MFSDPRKKRKTPPKKSITRLNPVRGIKLCNWISVRALFPDRLTYRRRTCGLHGKACVTVKITSKHNAHQLVPDQTIRSNPLAQKRPQYLAELRVRQQKNVEGKQSLKCDWF